MNEFIADKEQCSPKLREYFKALAFQIPGNILWSLRCLRYHPELCAEGEALLHSGAVEKINAQSEQDQENSFEDPEPLMQYDSDSEFSSPSSGGSPQSHPSSRSSVVYLNGLDDDIEDKKSVHLGTEVRVFLFSYQVIHVVLTSRIQLLLAPFEYISSLPSKGVREVLIDALNIWMGLPDRSVKTMKSIAQKLHSSSLM